MDLMTTGVVVCAVLFGAMLLIPPSTKKRKRSAFVLTLPILLATALVFGIAGQGGAVAALALGALYVFANYILG